MCARLNKENQISFDATHPRVSLNNHRELRHEVGLGRKS